MTRYNEQCQGASTVVNIRQAFAGPGHADLLWLVTLVFGW